MRTFLHIFAPPAGTARLSSIHCIILVIIVSIFFPIFFFIIFSSSSSPGVSSSTQTLSHFLLVHGEFHPIPAAFLQVLSGEISANLTFTPPYHSFVQLPLFLNSSPAFYFLPSHLAAILANPNKLLPTPICSSFPSPAFISKPSGIKISYFELEIIL